MKDCLPFTDKAQKNEQRADCRPIRRDRIYLSLVVPVFLGVTGIFWAAPAADILAIAITAVVMARLWKQLCVEDGREGTDAVLPEYPVREGVVVTISREHGSAGKRVGQLVAQKLGIPCYYKGMIVIAAQDHAICKIADAGSCVIVGRSADHVLRNRKDVVRIFITAPKAYRTQMVMEMYGDSREQAQKSIERSDTARKSYYESITGKKWGDSHNYELCVDSSMGVDETADLISSYVRMAFLKEEQA